jgi:hypothetical protein
MCPLYPRRTRATSGRARARRQLTGFFGRETSGRAAAGLIRSLAQLRNGLDQRQAPAVHNVSLFHQRVFCFIL